MAKSPARTDGVFGRLYATTADVRAVVAAFRVETGYGYREAWGAWFGWALNENSQTFDALPN